LTLACDVRIAADDAKIAILFRRIGAATDMGASYFLPRIVGAGRAAELALLGDDISATDALAMGLFNRIVPAAELDAATRELATRLATGPSSQTQIKRQLRASLHNTFAEQLDLEYETQGTASDSEDMIEGISAFLERRPTRFSGR
jgi:2-(1,2-epoxy-1,2-dihydrophenyl)acetyl-CoA isomerase